MSMDLLNAYVTTAYQIDNLWNVFMGVHLVFFSLVFKYGSRLELYQRIILMGGYVVFAFMNMRALTIKYSLLRNIRFDILDVSRRQELHGMLTYLAENPLNARISTVVAIHIIVGLVALYYIFEDSLEGRRRIAGTWCGTIVTRLANVIKILLSKTRGLIRKSGVPRDRL
jgi:hypothetical protein